MGYRVKELREALHMTQEELAAVSGVSRATIWALESGRNVETTTKTLRALARALQTTPSVLFFAVDD